MKQPYGTSIYICYTKARYNKIRASADSLWIHTLSFVTSVWGLIHIAYTIADRLLKQINLGNSIQSTEFHRFPVSHATLIKHMCVYYMILWHNKYVWEEAQGAYLFCFSHIKTCTPSENRRTIIIIITTVINSVSEIAFREELVQIRTPPCQRFLVVRAAMSVLSVYHSRESGEFGLKFAWEYFGTFGTRDFHWQPPLSIQFES